MIRCLAKLGCFSQPLGRWCVCLPIPELLLKSAEQLVNDFAHVLSGSRIDGLVYRVAHFPSAAFYSQDTQATCGAFLL